jgi:hypothetical protein
MMKLNKLQRKSSIPLSVKKEKPERTNFNNIKHTQKLLKEETTLLNSNITHWNVNIFFAVVELCLNLIKLIFLIKIDDSIVSNPEFNMSGLRRLPKSASAVHALINTPKILELDINRMIISENKIAYIFINIFKHMGTKKK